MPENCNPNDCPVSARVKTLEKELDRYREGSSETHRQMFDRIGALEKSDAVQDAHYSAIDAKLDELTIMVKELSGKAGRRWESLVEKALWAVVAAAIAFLLARIGL